MLDYIFFHPTPYGTFLAFLEENGVPTEAEEDGETFEVRVPEDLDEELEERIEAEYDRLFDENRDLHAAESESAADNYTMASVVLRLSDGRTSLADVSPDVMARILEAVGLDEWNKVVAAIVEAVENPDDRSFCQRVRDGSVRFGGDSE